MRLDRLLSQSGHGSRSQVRHIIRSGRVSLGGQLLSDPGFLLDDEAMNQVRLDGQPVVFHRHLHLMMNKEAGLVTAHRDARHVTVVSQLPDHWKNRRLSPVGRLDRDTTGLLLLTTDGQLNHRLTSPRWQVWKTYQVQYSGPLLQQEAVDRFEAGLVLSAQQQLLPARLTVLAGHQALLSLQEGKFHQVKRMFEALGRQVIRLHRTQLGPLALDPNLAAGHYRSLSPSEVAALYAAVALNGSGDAHLPAGTGD